MEEQSYARKNHPYCDVCIGILPNHGRPEYAQATNLEYLMQTSWTMVFHGRQDVTPILIFEVVATHVERYRMRFDQDPEGKPTLLLRNLRLINDPPELRLPKDLPHARILGTITCLTNSRRKILPEIRSDRFLVLGKREHERDGFVIPMPLVHVYRTTSFFT